MEIELRYRTNLIDQLEKYQGHGYWVHFSNTDKLGVNPQARHGDPKGIYFYYLDELFDYTRFRNGHQYATYYPHWTIVELIPNEHGMDQVSSEFWNDVKQGAATLRGIPYVVDSKGIIHNLEPHQLLVRDPKSIRIIARGVTKGTSDYKLGQGEDANTIMVINFYKKLLAQYGGEIKWKDKKPNLVMTISGASFSLSYDGFRNRMTMQSQWGDAQEIVSREMSKDSLDNLVKSFSGMIDMVVMYQKRKKYILFQPVRDIKNITAELKAFSTAPYDIRNLIRNKNKIIDIELVRDYQEGGNKISSRVVAQVTNETIRYSAYIKVNAYHLVNAQADDLNTLRTEIEKSFKERGSEFSPDNKSDYRKVFHSSIYYEAFLNWVVENSCLPISHEGQKEVINRDALMRDIKWTL